MARMIEQAHDAHRDARRRHWGTAVQVIDLATRTAVQCRSLNVSEAGVRLVSPTPFIPEAFVLLTLLLPGVPGLFDLHGQIRWCEKRAEDYLVGVVLDLATAEISHVPRSGFWAHLKKRLGW
jgi:hypothetical protein